MATNFHEVKNNAYSALASGINDIVETFSVAVGEGARFPTTNHWVLIDSELIEVESRAGDVFTVVAGTGRASQSTVAASHLAGAGVYLYVTAGEITELQTAVNSIESGMIPYSLFTAANDFLVGTGSGTGVKKTLAETKAILAHASSHEFMGGDALKIQTLFAAYSYGLIMHNWKDKTGWTENNTGGTNTAGLMGLAMATGGSANNIASLYSPYSYADDGASDNYQTLSFRIGPTSATWTNCLAYFGILESPAAPTDTQKHIAIKILNGDIYTSYGNGVTGTQTDTTLNAAQSVFYNFTILWDGTSLRFYRDTTLLLSATANLPDGFLCYILAYLKTTDTTEKTLMLHSPLLYRRGAL